MNDPDDRTGKDAEPSPMPDEVARHLRAWARTINRWAVISAEPCYLVTEDMLRPATPEDVAEAVERLRDQRRQRNE